MLSLCSESPLLQACGAAPATASTSLLSSSRRAPTASAATSQVLARRARPWRRSVPRWVPAYGRSCLYWRVHNRQHRNSSSTHSDGQRGSRSTDEGLRAPPARGRGLRCSATDAESVNGEGPELEGAATIAQAKKGNKGQKNGNSGTNGSYKRQKSTSKGLFKLIEQLAPEPGQRAASVTDHNVLRRKGHLKEQDSLIQFIINLHEYHDAPMVMELMEQWIEEYREIGKRAKLKSLVPFIGKIFTPLPLVKALDEYDSFSHLTQRKFVKPNFAEIRHILNIAQVRAITDTLQLITFDADGTLYADGHHFDEDNEMIGHIIDLLRCGVTVGIVTAAGYPDEAHKFETRLSGLLEGFERAFMPGELQYLDRFFVMGGECNYLLRPYVCDERKSVHLKFVEPQRWQLPSMLAWKDKDITKLLDNAQDALEEACDRLRLQYKVIRKERSVGIVPTESTIYEVLEEITLSTQNRLRDSELPYCAFNGGSDVFVDVGSKSLGLQALMKFLKCKSHETLHVGDRFTVSGNDKATRTKCCILWVANPAETGFFLKLAIRDLQQRRVGTEPRRPPVEL